ncbi:MAG: FAD-binding oxidoreductase [Geminicoccaceae bacterium]
MNFRQRPRFQPSEEFLRHLETGELGYTAEQLHALRNRLAGRVITPGPGEYQERRMGFVPTYQTYPQLIVYCEVQSDVVACLDFAREVGLHVVARSGGHSTAGYSVNEQMVIDVSHLAHVLVDAPAKRARVGAGTNFRKLNLMLDGTGLHLPSGSCETVCVAGYMQGGGYSFTSRLFGMHCDSVEAVTMALPSGEIVRADADEHPDLYWAVRGGTGSQFGVLLEIEYRLHELGQLWGFGLRWPLASKRDIAKAAEVLAIWQAGYTKGETTTKISSQVFLMHAPVSAAEPTPVPCLLVRGVYDGSEEACRTALAPLLAELEGPDPKPEIWESGSYLRLNEILWQCADPRGEELPAVSFNAKALVDSRIVAELQPAREWRRIIDFYLGAPDRADFIAIESYGGAVNVPAPDATAFVHRRASLNFFVWTFWSQETHEAPARAWLKRFGTVADRISNGHRYQNYPLRGNTGFREQYFGANLDRLLEIKQRYDPDNLFAYEQSLTPA